MSFLNQHLFNQQTVNGYTQIQTMGGHDCQYSSTWRRISGCVDFNGLHVFFYISSSGVIGYAAFEPGMYSTATISYNSWFEFIANEYDNPYDGNNWVSCGIGTTGVVSSENEQAKVICVRENKIYGDDNDTAALIGYYSGPQILYIPPGSYIDIVFDSVSSMYVALGNRPVAADYFIATTTDLNNWTRTYLPINLPFNKLYQKNGLYILTAQSSSILLISNDTTQWSSVLLPNSVVPSCVHISSEYVLVFQYENNSYLRCPIAEIGQSSSWVTLQLDPWPLATQNGEWITCNGVDGIVVLFGYTIPEFYVAVSYDHGLTFSYIDMRVYGLNTRFPIIDSCVVEDKLMAIGHDTSTQAGDHGYFIVFS